MLCVFWKSKYKMQGPPYLSHLQLFTSNHYTFIINYTLLNSFVYKHPSIEAMSQSNMTERKVDFNYTYNINNINYMFYIFPKFGRMFICMYVGRYIFSIIATPFPPAALKLWHTIP